MRLDARNVPLCCSFREPIPSNPVKTWESRGTNPNQNKEAIRQLYQMFVKQYGSIFEIEKFGSLQNTPTPFVMFAQIMQMGVGTSKNYQTIQERLGFTQGQIERGQIHGELRLTQSGENVLKLSVNETMRQVLPVWMENRKFYT